MGEFRRGFIWMENGRLVVIFKVLGVFGYIIFKCLDRRSFNWRLRRGVIFNSTNDFYIEIMRARGTRINGGRREGNIH